MQPRAAMSRQIPLAPAEAVLRGVLLSLSLAVGLASAGLVRREYRVALLHRAPGLTALATLAVGAPALPLSSRGLRELFLTCAGVQTGIALALQPATIRNAVNDNCRAAAETALTTSPTLSAAHLVRMLALRETPAAMAALRASAATAPAEVWQARLRLPVALSLLARGASDLADVAGADTRLMMQGAEGRRWLARHYAENAAQRKVLRRAIDTAPEPLKALFLTEVRALAAGHD